MVYIGGVTTVLLLSLMESVAIADDWTVTRLTGTVLELANGHWERLERGDIVSDDRLVRSLNGPATFERGQESIDLTSDTIIQINDRAGQQFTVVVNPEVQLQLKPKCSMSSIFRS